MRVLHVMEATVGGTRRHLVDVAAAQVELGLEVVVVASAERAPDFREDLASLAGRGVLVRELPMVRAIRPALDWCHQRALEALLRELRPDVVHTHSSKAGVLGRLASLGCGIGARVHTPHTFAFLFAAMFGPLQRGLFREVERALAQSTRAVVAVSESEGLSIRASGVVPAERVRVVTNGIDPRPWIAGPTASRSSLGIPAGVPLAAVVGLLNPAKGQDLALRALAAPELGGLHLLLVGEGETRVALAALADELGLGARCRFLGWRDDVPELMRACDFLLLPSRWEGLPYVALEAQAAGLPVVSARVDGARDVIEHGRTGLLVEAGSWEALAEGCRELLALSRPERGAMGRAGREHVLEHHTVPAMARGLLAVYSETT